MLASYNLSLSVTAVVLVVVVHVFYTEATVHGYFSKQVFLKLCNVHRKKPVFNSFFNKVEGFQGCNFMKKKVQDRCFPVPIMKQHLWW